MKQERGVNKMIIEQLIFTFISFAIFVYMFFRMIKNNDTSYVFVLCNVNGGLFIGIEKKLFYSHFIRLISGYYLGHIIIDDFQPSVEIHI